MPELRDELLDGPDASRLLAAFETEVASLYPGWSPTSGPSADPNEFVAPEGLFLVGFESGRALSCGGFKRLSPDTVEIKRLYVIPELRGQGLARQVMDELETRARGAGYRRARLDTGSAQPGALHLYRSRGYVAIADYNENPFATHWFEKQL